MRVKMAFSNCRYILITPAHNEEANIERTIKSLISQTFLPTKWVIVSDGSTDRTDEIVKKYSQEYSWIELIRMPEHSDRQFAAKVQCFNAGYKKAKELDFDIIGNLDADISFEKDYFEFLVSKFVENSRLGVQDTLCRRWKALRLSVYKYRACLRSLPIIQAKMF